jgi:ribosomal protein S27AE
MSEYDFGTQVRTYTGEEKCRGLVDWLNRDGQTPAGLRIQAWLSFLHVLSEAAPSLGGAVGTFDLKEVIAALAKGQGGPRAESVRRLLKDPGFPRVHVHVKVKFEGVGESRRIVPLIVADTVEGEALLRVLRISQEGVLDRVKKCPRCGNWFFARFKHQRFCKRECQQKHFRESPAWKAHRNQWARNYYKETRFKRQMPNTD